MPTQRQKKQKANKASVRARRRTALERRQRVAVMMGLGHTRTEMMRELRISHVTLDTDIRWVKDNAQPLEIGAIDALLADVMRELATSHDYGLLLKYAQERIKLWGLTKQEADLTARLEEAADRMARAMEERQSKPTTE